jgi:hypothetical protein
VKTECTFLSHFQKSGKNHNIEVVNKSFKNVAKFLYLGTSLSDHNYIHEIKKKT